ncbi:MAG: MarR family transcriptional regulator [Rhodospirillaceae bacterium]|nr:MarR family transcriptional regulator [Rhodospirillaceae bacterium]
MTEPTFAVVPPALIRHSDLAAGPLKLLVYLIGCRAKRGDPEGEDPEFYWRPAAAARTLNCTGQAIRKWRAALERAGIYSEDCGPFSAWLEMSGQPGFETVAIENCKVVDLLHNFKISFQSLGLAPADWRLLAFLESWAPASRILDRWSVARVARETGRSRRACLDALNRLAEAGFVTLYRGPKGAQTIIGLNDPSAGRRNDHRAQTATTGQ